VGGVGRYSYTHGTPIMSVDTTGYVDDDPVCLPEDRDSLDWSIHGHPTSPVRPPTTHPDPVSDVATWESQRSRTFADENIRVTIRATGKVDRPVRDSFVQGVDSPIRRLDGIQGGELGLTAGEVRAEGARGGWGEGAYSTWQAFALPFAIEVEVLRGGLAEGQSLEMRQRIRASNKHGVPSVEQRIIIAGSAMYDKATGRQLQLHPQYISPSFRSGRGGVFKGQPDGPHVFERNGSNVLYIDALRWARETRQPVVFEAWVEWQADITWFAVLSDDGPVAERYSSSRISVQYGAFLRVDSSEPASAQWQFYIRPVFGVVPEEPPDFIRLDLMLR
jgi:hypothetical protein